jgi:signal transduction histidine kinase
LPATVTRGRSSAGATGLGVDIARRVAQSAGGALHLRNLPEGGACAELVLPRAG